MADWIGVDMSNGTCGLEGCEQRGRTVRGLCIDHYRQALVSGDELPQFRRPCSIDRCGKPAVSSRRPLCEMHQTRVDRHGSPDMVTFDVSLNRPRRYQQAYQPRHPLATARGIAYVHRVVLFDSIGPGSHPCHWCSRTVTWELPRAHRLRLVVDHLNSVTDDNRLENLVPACLRCNTLRGQQDRAALLRALGY